MKALDKKALVADIKKAWKKSREAGFPKHSFGDAAERIGKKHNLTYAEWVYWTAIALNGDPKP